MNEEVLDWKGALAGGCERAEYVGRLREFVARERETAARVEQALKSGHAEEARALLHAVRGTAAGLGARALAAAALELEMAVRAGADTTRALGHFSTAHMDALLSMQAFLSQ
ncbi:MAG: Hpt domain-containing protein [Desulfovibrio sp.]|nr:Hpt domain-containing protein [Desulfovibrio sp.]